jgi:hypothetical protein
MEDPISTPSPYQSPRTDTSTPEANVSQQRQLLRDYRTTIFSLGTFWILLGLSSAGLSISALANKGDEDVGLLKQITVGLALVNGFAWTALGIYACLKQLWAVYVGLLISYVFGLVLLAQFNFCWLVFVVAAITQSHYVISMARKLMAQGISPETTLDSLVNTEADSVDNQHG